MSAVQECEPLRSLRRIATVRPITLGVDPALDWLVVRIEDRAGNVGLGEATLERQHAHVARAIELLTPSLIGQDPRRHVAQRADLPGNLTEAAAQSAVNQALWDLAARQNRVQLAIMRTGHQARVPELYANLNRAIGPDRSPEAFVEVAQRARSQGYRIVKIAPFDGVERRPLSDHRTSELVAEGIRRTQAVLEVPGLEVRVDLHWRFELSAAVRVVHELNQLGLGWIEAPVRESALNEWRAIRDRTDARLAGGETLTGPQEFEAFLRASQVDVVMPDIKYCGGVDGFREVMDVAEAHGAAVSPHNPSGPVATLATIHAAAGRHLDSLEIPWRPEPNPIDVVHGARIVLPPGDGIGLRLSPEVETDYPGRPEPDHAPTDLI